MKTDFRQLRRPSCAGLTTACALLAIVIFESVVVADDLAKHWSFRPVEAVSRPSIDDAWVRDPIDAFVLEKLRAKQLEPSTGTDRRTLVRRAHFVLHGLPPDPETVERVRRDPRADWYERLVDDLLQSPRYGERFARHWLDTVRYAESNGFETNRPRKSAYHYRDYVIRAFNVDLPYDRFIMEQLAGDALGEDAATGFLVAGPHDLVKSPDKELTLMQRAAELADIVNATSSTFLGLSVACARCHNHKFDPVSQTDYYAMVAVFAGVQHGEREVPRRRTDDDVAKNLRQSEETRGSSSGEKVWAGTFRQPEETHRLFRGNPSRPREVVFPDALEEFGSLPLAPDAPEQQRRLELAKWIASTRNPFAVRVMVNRLWQWIFGEGIVSTPNDLGTNGAPPTHPELLDYLAGEFTRGGWSVKSIVRRLVLSSTFRQASVPRAGAIGVDGGNRLLWRFAPRRLEAEAIRDSILAISGVLDLRLGGPGFDVVIAQPGNVYNYVTKTEFGPEDWRRSIYGHQIRGEQDATFGVFDCPDGGQIIPRRARSTTALQALNLLNSPFILQQARLFAERLRREASDVSGQLGIAFGLAFQRDPDEGEREDAGRLVQTFGLEAFARALFNANELLFTE